MDITEDIVIDISFQPFDRECKECEQDGIESESGKAGQFREERHFDSGDVRLGELGIEDLIDSMEGIRVVPQVFFSEQFLLEIEVSYPIEPDSSFFLLIDSDIDSQRDLLLYIDSIEVV